MAWQNGRGLEGLRVRVTALVRVTLLLALLSLTSVSLMTRTVTAVQRRRRRRALKTVINRSSVTSGVAGAEVAAAVEVALPVVGALAALQTRRLAGLWAC